MLQQFERPHPFGNGKAASPKGSTPALLRQTNGVGMRAFFLRFTTMATPPSAQPARTPLEQAVYNALCDADLATRLWPIMAARYQRIDKCMTIGVAAFSCFAVGSWIGWKGNPGAYQLLSIAAAITSVAQPLLNWGSQVEAMYNASARWVEYKTSYQQLWNSLTQLSEADAWAKLHEIQHNETGLTAECQRFPQGSKTLKDKVMADVMAVHR